MVLLGFSLRLRSVCQVPRDASRHCWKLSGVSHVSFLSDTLPFTSELLCFNGFASFVKIWVRGRGEGVQRRLVLQPKLHRRLRGRHHLGSPLRHGLLLCLHLQGKHLLISLAMFKQLDLGTFGHAWISHVSLSTRIEKAFFLVGWERTFQRRELIFLFNSFRKSRWRLWHYRITLFTSPLSDFE